MEEKLFCRHCGKQIPHDSIFCQHCGKSVDLVKENLVTCVDEVKDEKESSLKIEIVKTSDSKNEERAKKFVSRLIREVVLIALFVGIAFAGKGALYHVFVQSNQPPLVTEERQQAFKDAIFKLEHPNGLPPCSWDDYFNGNYDKEKYPTVYIYSFGLPLAELGVGEYKYDGEATTMSDYENLNDFRKCTLERHAEKASNTFFWILIIGIPLLRYIILLFKWLNPDTSPKNSSSTPNIQNREENINKALGI